MDKLDELLERHTPHEIAQVAKCRTTEIVYFVNTRIMPPGIDWDAVHAAMPKPESSEEGEKRKAGRPPKAEKEV